jgi:hypothetical protein
MNDATLLHMYAQARATKEPLWRSPLERYKIWKQLHYWGTNNVQVPTRDFKSRRQIVNELNQIISAGSVRVWVFLRARHLQRIES